MRCEMMVKVLDLLGEDPSRWWTSPEVGRQLGLTVPHASELLRQYRNRGLLRRHRVRTKYNPPRLYEYQVSRAGLRKLEYLTSEEYRTGEMVREQLGAGGIIGTYITKKLRR